MVDNHYGFALVLHVTKQLQNGIFRRRIHADKRLVHQVDVRLLSEGTGDKNTLLLTSGELRNLAVCKL